MTLIEPRVPSMLPAFHLLGLLVAVAWAASERRHRPTSRGSWRLALAVAVLAGMADVLLVLSAWSGGLAAALVTIAFILALSLLALILLQGWPSRPLVALAALGVAAPFLMWLG